MSIKTILNIVLLSIMLIVLVGCEKPAPPKKGTIVLKSIPEGASLFLGDQKLGVTPTKLSGYSGKRRLRVEKLGYQTQWIDVVLTNGKSRQEEIRLSEQGSDVLIESIPKGANVSLQGKMLGITPLVMKKVMPGKYDLQISKLGYSTQSLPLEVKDSRPQALRLNIISNLGRVVIKSSPEKARVFIDGKPYGFTPFKGQLEAGVHQLRLEKSGAIPLATTFTLVKNGQFSKSYTLAVSPGTVSVKSTPEGASVWINEKLVGITPIEVKDIAAGVATLRIEKNGFDIVKKDIEVVSDNVTSEEFMLEESTGKLVLSVIPAGVSVYLNDKFVGVVEATPGASVNRTQLIRLDKLAPGNYRVTVAHKRAVPERKTAVITVKKGRVNRPEPIILWVPNVEIKWRDSGLVEVGMLYAETDSTLTFGAEPGYRVVYDRNKALYVKKLNINE